MINKISSFTGYSYLSIGPYSCLLDKRAITRNFILAAILVLVCIGGLGSGTVPLSPWEVVNALLGKGDAMAQFVVQELRLKRLLAGIYTGAAFSLAGCLMQTLARNRLATPGIIGIDNAAMAFAVSSIVSTSISIAPSAMALAGSATAAALAFGLSAHSGTRGYRFIVAGIAIGSVAGAMTQIMLSQVAVDTANTAYPWTVGSLNSPSKLMVHILGVGLLICLIGCLLLTHVFSLLPFSDPVVTGLGRNMKHLRLIALSLSILLTGLAVSVAGPVGLIALIGPEMARVLMQYRGTPLISSALTGSLIMVVADIAGRTAFSPVEIPVGILTSIVGGPYLIWVLIRQDTNRSL
ncbi:iron ABC transporter permease [Marinomonas sp. C2222]|uniref:Iron ABC transporter permease n=1 Tax=Marinomonas sargassi TaxID=2984494 RepID=A0ABT2YNM0_9GAMM|nr:iron ABC transporter permease [Marinomonas sargassi]MCV2401475.1 iron ABC transporter permease [Marinomonas sargassi]